MLVCVSNVCIDMYGGEEGFTACCTGSSVQNRPWCISVVVCCRMVSSFAAASDAQPCRLQLWCVNERNMCTIYRSFGWSTGVHHVALGCSAVCPDDCCYAIATRVSKGRTQHHSTPKTRRTDKHDLSVHGAAKLGAFKCATVDTRQVADVASSRMVV